MKVYEYEITPNGLTNRVVQVNKIMGFMWSCFMDIGFYIDDFNQIHDGKIFLSFRELSREESLKLFLRSKR